MSTSVKHIHNGMRGAPALSGTAGTLLAVLEALFVTGWGATTAVSVNVAGGIATATLTPGETFDRDAVVLVAGAGAPHGALNGEARVLTSGNTAITWATTAPDGAATGTITIKYAPQTAWSKPFAATNKAVFRSTHVQSNGHYLRIDDTGTTTARVRGYESMTDVDTGTGPFPTEVQMAGGGYWWKSTAASAAPVKYRIVCDERFILFLCAAGFPNGATLLGAPARGFGDPLHLSPSGDAWSTVLSYGGPTNNAVATGSFVTANTQLSAGATGACVMPRGLAGLGGAVQMAVFPDTAGQTGHTGQDSHLGTVPSEVDGQIKTSRTFVRENTTGKSPRAYAPGVLYIPQQGVMSVMADGDKLDGAGSLAGRRLMLVTDPGGNAFNNVPSNAYLVDITGPWR